MKYLKLLLRLLLFALIGLIAAAMIIPVVFKDDIIAAVKSSLNDNLNAQVDFADVSISLLSDFPRGSISIDSLSITGTDNYEGIPLTFMKTAKTVVSLSSIVRKNTPIEIKEIVLEKPFVNIIIDKSGNANYNIAKPVKSTESSNFYINLEKYQINKGSIIYLDEESGQELVLQGLDHSGFGSFSSKKYDLNTKTSINDINFSNGGVSYLNSANAIADIIIAVDVEKNIFKFKENKIKLNDLDLNMDGHVQLTKEDVIMELTFGSPEENIKGIMSVIPGLYSENFNDVIASGKSSFSGVIKGKYNNNSGIYPAINFNGKIGDGMFQYPNLPKKMNNINGQFNIKANQGSYDDLMMNIPHLNFDLGENHISAMLTSTYIDNDLDIKGELEGKFVLDDWKDVIPLSNIEKLFGYITTDINFAGKQSDIVEKKFDNLTFVGTIRGDDIIYKATDQPQIKIDDLNSVLSPQSIEFSSPYIKAGESDVDGSVSIINPLALLTTEGVLNTSVRANSKLIDLDEWMAMSNSSSTDTSSVLNPSLANIDVDIKSDILRANGYEVKNFNLKGQHQSNSMQINQISGKVENSDFYMTGQVDNTLEYINNNNILSGKMSLKSDNLILEDFMTNSEKSPSDEVVLVPENIDIDITSHVKRAVYDNITLTNLDGNLKISNRQAILENGKANGLGGKIQFSGLYGTPEGERPDFAFKYDLSDLDFEETAASVAMTQSLVPIMKFVQGQFNSTLVMDGKLGDNMFPDISTLNASGFLETISGKLQELDIANKLADKLGIEVLRKLDFDHTKNWFDIIDGHVEVKPFDITVEDIKVNIAGRHGLGKSMDYQILLDVPREMFKNNVVASVAESGLTFLESEASKIGISIEQGDFINLKINLTGSLADPSFKITPLGSGGKSTPKDIVINQIDNVKKTVQDSAKTIIEDTKTAITDSVNSTIETTKDSISNAIIETSEEIKDSVKTAVSEIVTEQVGDIVKDSTVQETVNDIIEGQTGKTVEDIKDKIKDWNPFKKKKDK